MKSVTTICTPMNRPLMFALAAAASALLVGCSHMGTQDRMDHGAMSSGTSGGMGMGMMKPGADCPMMSADERKMMCDGKSDDDGKRVLDEHRQAMHKRMQEKMKEHMKADGPQASAAAPDAMCDMGMKDKQ